MIRVDDDFIIDVDSMNYMPKVKRIRTNKETGEKYEHYEVLGYYSTLQGAIRGVLDYKVRILSSVEEKPLETALKEVERIYKQFNELLGRILDGEYDE